MGLDPQKDLTYQDLLNGGPARPVLDAPLAPLSAHIFELKTP